MLKLLAWDDRRHDKRQHDGVDLKYLAESYDSAKYLDDLYERGAPFLEEFNFNNELAAAALLGADVRSVAGPRVMKRLREILAREVESGTLFLDMPGDPDHNSQCSEHFGRGWQADTCPGRKTWRAISCRPEVPSVSVRRLGPYGPTLVFG